jgi:hypothetical protein
MNRSFWTRGSLTGEFVLVIELKIVVCGGLRQRRVP